MRLVVTTSKKGDFVDNMNKFYIKGTSARTLFWAFVLILAATATIIIIMEFMGGFGLQTCKTNFQDKLRHEIIEPSNNFAAGLGYDVNQEYLDTTLETPWCVQGMFVISDVYGQRIGCCDAICPVYIDYKRNILLQTFIGTLEMANCMSKPLQCVANTLMDCGTGVGSCEKASSILNLGGSLINCDWCVSYIEDVQHCIVDSPQCINLMMPGATQTLGTSDLAEMSRILEYCIPVKKIIFEDFNCEEVEEDLECNIDSRKVYNVRISKNNTGLPYGVFANVTNMGEVQSD